MKQLLILGLSLVACLSCSKFDLGEFPQKWQLVKVTSNQVYNGQVNTGTEMEIQEFYWFNSDGTFIKSREKDGRTFEASGSFIVKENGVEKYFELIFVSADDPLIGSCNPGKEVLLIKTEDTIVGTWSYCDGPILEYKRIK